MSAVQEHELFMAAALGEAAKAARAGDFPVGCVLVLNKQIVATGFRRNSTINGNEIDHAEIVALRELISVQNSADLSEVILYSTMEPCLMCFSTLILNGVRTIVYGYEDAMGGGTQVKLVELPPLYTDMKVTVIPHILRNQCLHLFKEFFSDNENVYWKDSLLARYTLQQ
jgi:tRNA(adenine34) deaminase